MRVRDWQAVGEVVAGRLGGFKALAAQLLVALALQLPGAGCATSPKRIVTDPVAATTRLRGGGSIETEVSHLAEPLIASGEIRGIAVGVLTPDGHTQFFGYGRTGIPGSPQPPNSETIFQVGSVSKLFVTAVLASLVEEGTLRYEDTVRSLLPPGVRLSDDVGRLTVYELVTNTGGFPREPFCLSQLRDFTSFVFTGRNLYRYFDKPFLYAYLRKKSLRPKAARSYVYSNIGFGLLAHLMEVRTGRSYQDLLQERICRPLGLADTTLVLDEEQKGRLAMGHVGVQPCFMRRGRPMEPWDMGEILGPPGCLYSTVKDLLLFARSNLGMAHHPLEPVLAGTQSVRWITPLEDVGFGWIHNYLGDTRLHVTFKQGVMSGYTAYVGLNTDAQMAVAVLYNTFSWDELVGHNLLLRLSRGLAPAAGPAPQPPAADSAPLSSQ